MVAVTSFENSVLQNSQNLTAVIDFLKNKLNRYDRDRQRHIRGEAFLHCFEVKFDLIVIFFSGGKST